MLCRALLTIIAVSYLICVLILSGLQKEDLDVNMLKKLERHGLDIEDMNNESLREDCLRRGKIMNDKLIHTEDPITTSITTENISRIEINQQRDKSNDKETKENGLNAVIKYFMDLQKPEHKTKTKNFNDSTTIKYVFDGYHISENNNLKYIFTDIIGYNSPQLNKNNLQTTTDRTFNLFSQNMLRLWDTYTKQGTREFTAESTTLQTTSSNPIRIKDNNNSEIDIVKKIIAEYLSKTQMIFTTTQIPPKKQINIARLSEEISRFLANAQNATNNNLRNGMRMPDNVDMKPQNKFYENKTGNDFYYSIKKETDNLFDQIPTLNNKNFVSELTSTSSNMDIIKFNEQKRINDSFIEYNNVQNNTGSPFQNNNRNMENYTSFKDESIFNTINNLYANMEKNNDPKSNAKALTKDIIKEIAESVKTMVLRDLKKEILTVTTTSTATTTATSSTVASKDIQEKGIEATHMMEKIMEMFQQFKSTKEKTIIAGQSQMKVTEKKDIKHEYKGPVKVIYSSNKPAVSPYGVRSPTEQFAPIFVTQYNHDQSMNAPKYMVLPNIQSPVYQMSQIDNVNVRTGHRQYPITIQTNSFEIPPLGIPIERPLNMVNQNIIVTTKSPYLRPRLDTHHTNYNYHIDRYKIEDDFRTPHDRENNPNKEYKPFMRDDAYTFDGHDNFKIKISDRSRFYNHNDRNYEEHYKPHYTKSDYDRMKLRNQEVKRFHERLEKTDESKNIEERDDCCKLQVASRQQLPLTNAKKRTKFDDVHFRNFLKTQQKVNDMLEKILATRAKSDGPRSVETT